MNLRVRTTTGVVVLACALAGWGASVEAAPPAEREMPPAELPPEIPPGAAPQTLKKAVWGLPFRDGESMFPRYRDLGVGLFQTQAHWDQIARKRPDHPSDPTDSAYDWPKYLENEIEEAERWGMEVTIQLIGAPAWANGGRSWRWAPDEAEYFEDFVTAISRRYPTVSHWMVWGEPNRKPNFAPFTAAPPTATRLTKKQARAPRRYALLVDSAYEAVKTLDPADLLIGGSTYFSGGKGNIRPYPWIRYMKLPDGSRPRMDMWGHNPYSYRKPNLRNRPSPLGRVDFSDLRRLGRALNRAFPGSPLPLFLSEFGIPTAYDQDFKFSVSEETAAKWTRAAMRIVRGWDRIYTLGWSVPVDTHRNPQGLLDFGGDPKPAYDAFKSG
jgi:hypothetical protein